MIKYVRNVITSLLCAVVCATAQAESLDSHLSVFEPYLGTWQADFAVPEGQAPMRDVSRLERALNGTAIRTVHSINDGMYGGESFIFWDKDQKSLIFYYFTTAGFYTQGGIEVLDSGEFVAYEAVTGSDEGITEVKSTSRMEGGKMHITTQYLKNGQWTTPESRSYQRSTLPVIFK